MEETRKASPSTTESEVRGVGRPKDSVRCRRSCFRESSLVGSLFRCRVLTHRGVGLGVSVGRPEGP